MKLYYSPGACSLSPHIVMREAGIPVELSKVDLGSHRAEGDLDFSQINSKGYVPALDMGGGQVLTEGPVIVQYLGDQKPDSGLVPKAGTIERYRLAGVAQLHHGRGAQIVRTAVRQERVRRPQGCSPCRDRAPLRLGRYATHRIVST